MPYSSYLSSSIRFGRLAAISFLTLGLASVLSAETSHFDIRIIVEGLSRPTAIASNHNNFLYFSEVPTPGVFGTAGGENTVKRLKLSNLGMTTISEGEPYPINIALDDRRNVYWTCMTAGVILKYNNKDGKTFFLPPDPTAPGANFLMSPIGIAVDTHGDVLFTEVPVPGTPGANMVSVSDGELITLISQNEPAPTDIAVARDGTAYWTCNTFGVIIKRTPAGVISILKRGLESPTGIAINYNGDKLYYTELPTPGMSGADGGTNRVVELNLRTMKMCNVSVGFPLPTDVTVTPKGIVYWTCTKAGVIACATPLYLKNQQQPGD